MRGCKIEIAPERIAEGQQLYEFTETPVPDIATRWAFHAALWRGGSSNGVGRRAARRAIRPTARWWLRRLAGR